jgi:prophage tail gpP-like protein
LDQLVRKRANAVALITPLYLDIGGRSFGGWLRVRIERSIDNATIQWGIGATRSWPGAEEQWWIEPGDRVTVRAYDQPLCNGWIDVIRADYDGVMHHIELSGRGLVSDLVDCSYTGPPWQWKSVDPAEVIRTVARQHQIQVRIEADLGEPIEFQIQQGEACWDAIERICRLRGVLAYEEPDGSLIITRGSDSFLSTRLVQGENILAATGTLDERDRFSHYIVKGQQKTKNGDDSVSPEQASFSIGEVRDPSVRRYRPMLLVQSANTDNATALERANWEKQQRWGKARKAEITLGGWLQPSGELWPINRMCECVDAWMGLDRQLAITSLVMDVSNQGLRTVLTLQPPEALTPEPVAPEKQPRAKPKKGGAAAGAGAGGPSFWDQVAADRVQGEARRRESKQ